jgi:serine/threonine-protein kinase
VPQPAVSARTDVAEADEGQQEGLLSRSAYLWLTGVFVLIVLLVGMLTVVLNTRDTKIEVPMFLGMTVEQANEKAREANVTLEQDDRGDLYSNDYEEGRIAAQSPGPRARLDRDKAVVEYRLSKGPATKPVPDLIGRQVELEAYQAAEDAGFTIGKVTTEYSDKVPLNAVIRQDPEKGSPAPPGSSISLVISLGSKPEPPTQDTGATEGKQRNFAVSVRVQPELQGQQEVRIVVDDDRGETTIMQEFHDPGDTFDQDVVAYGDRVRIRVYVGGRVVSDKSY